VPGTGLRRALSAQALGAALALGLVAALALPGAALAKPTYGRVPASTGIVFTLHGSHGFKIDVVGGRHEVFAQASKTLGHGVNSAVDYNLNGPKAVDGSRVDIRLPGVARFDAHFVSTKVGHEELAPSECKPAATTVEDGYLVGSLSFRGERGFTTARATKVAATIDRTPARECRKPSPRQRQTPAESRAAEESEAGLRSVEVIAGERGAGIGLIADRVEPTEGEPGSPESVLIVTAASRSRGMRISHVVIASSVPPSGFTASAPGATPREATLAPPAPFSGSATFQLRTPTKGSWTGDLAVGLPGLGRILLTGARFYAGLCENSKCTKTLPESSSRGLQLQLIR
jgi:hypothetical protein